MNFPRFFIFFFQFFALVYDCGYICTVQKPLNFANEARMWNQCGFCLSGRLQDLEPHLSFFQPTQLLNWKILSFERACISMTSSGDNIVECSSFCSSDECRKNGGIKSVRFSFIAKNIVSANPRILKENLIRAFYYVQLWAEILERLSLLKF